MPNLRLLAARVIYQVVLSKHSLTDCLKDALVQVQDARDQGLLQSICFGVCRWYFRLDKLAQLLLEKPLKRKDQDIYSLILVGLYQLAEMRVPAHAAISETVSATRGLKKIWAKNLVNAILRRYQRDFMKINKEIESNSAAFYAHPQWMIDVIQKNWPVEWQAILTANNQHPPFSLRVNKRKISRADYLLKLKESHLDAKIIPETTTGIILNQPLNVKELPGFLTGEISVQDGAGQLVAGLLELKPNQRVLDACAAPGGKTTHILESQKDIELIAVDCDEHRLEAVRDNLTRLHLSATCICADVAETATWWDGQLFDRILLDAPCSASGVIRRHPDIKILRCATDIAKLVKQQVRLINAMWDILKPGGWLVYATCSIFSEENVDVMQTFLASHSDAIEEKIIESWGKECVIGRQILTGIQEMDGFYFARLSKAIPLPTG
ncbi:MAG: rsmB [Gammaproteobacteria bacterium]|jgi:16S rRNA (cytosine967-C5)-methyltransferase|nr:rsmB [Gammaproteobacteria bacterium]